MPRDDTDDPCSCGHSRAHHDAENGHCMVHMRTPEGGLRWIDSCGAFRSPAARR